MTLTEGQPAKSTVKQIDTSHPYFLASSDSPGMNLITTSFDGTSFGNGKNRVLISLSANNKLGFINGTCTMHKRIQIC